MKCGPVYAVSLALTALTIVVANCRSAQAFQTEHRHAIAGQTIKLDSWTIDCKRTPAPAAVLSPPHGGTTIERVERDNDGHVNLDGSLAKCQHGIASYRAFYYTPHTDFSGEDRVAVRVGSSRTWDFLYIIDVKVDRGGSIGIQYQSVTAKVANNLGMKKAKGVLVVEPIADGPAAKAGIEAGDVITAVNGEPVKDRGDFLPQIRSMAPGTAAKLYVLHKGQDKIVNLVLGQSPNRPEAEEENGGSSADARPKDADAKVTQPAGNSTATNAGDFFAGVEKNATSAAGNRPGAPAGTNAGDFFSQVPTQSEQPRASQNTTQSGSAKPPASSLNPSSDLSPSQGLSQ